MLAWTILILGSFILGVLASLIKWRYSLPIILFIPAVVIFMINSYYDSVALDPHYLQSANNFLAYFYFGIPSIAIALTIYYLIRYYRDNKPTDN